MLHTDIPHESPVANIHLGTAGLEHPARVPAAVLPGGYDRIVCIRLHGSPRIYYSAYPTGWLEPISRTIAEKAALGISTWCIFDDTTLGAATTDALTVKSHLLDSQRVP